MGEFSCGARAERHPCSACFQPNVLQGACLSTIHAMPWPVLSRWRLHAPGGIPHVSGEPFRTGGALGESYGRRMRGGTGTGAGAMRGRQRLGALLLLLAVLLAVKLGQQVYRWFAYDE